MGRLLNTHRWFDIVDKQSGAWRLKRVSAAAEKQFPKRYREVYAKEGGARLVKLLMVEKGWSMTQAWDEIKRMMNEGGPETWPRRPNVIVLHRNSGASPIRR